MHVGMTTFFQNLHSALSDREVYLHELSMADMAEPMGFESIWSAEHHFDDYTMCPNVAQFLTYMAGRTERVRLGSMVMVLPWHDPIRLAEEVSVLDHVSGGRAILGIGRGLGRIEFEGFRREMGESRERFIEYSEAILEALPNHLGFGFGHHFCLGASLARLEAIGALKKLVPELPRLQRVNPEPEFLDSYLIRGRARLELQPAV